MIDTKLRDWGANLPSAAGVVRAQIWVWTSAFDSFVPWLERLRILIILDFYYWILDFLLIDSDLVWSLKN